MRAILAFDRFTSALLSFAAQSTPPVIPHAVQHPYVLRRRCGIMVGTVERSRVCNAPVTRYAAHGMTGGAWRVLLRMVAVLAILVTPALTAHAANAEFAAFLDSLRPEAAAAGVSNATFDAAVRGLEPDFSIPDLDLPGRDKTGNKGQAEFTRPPSEYLDKAYMARLAEQAKPYLARHGKEFQTIESRIGVDRYSLLAFWARETALGTYKLPHDAIRVLATLAYVGRRKDVFRAELIAALGMLESGVPREKMRSSWAGAVGLTQFMPTEFKPYAQDIDGDGVKNIFTSAPDALGSTAAQLAGKGWVAGRHWGYEVTIPPAGSCAMEGPLQEKPVAEWAKIGFKRAGGKPWTATDLATTAYLMSPAGAYGPAFLVFENFKVIRRYNTSDLYAVFVGHLADRIAGGGDFHTSWAGAAPQKTVVVEEIQNRLKSLGYDVDKIDGKIGSNTRMNIGKYQVANRLKTDCWPSDAVLAHMRRAAAQ